MDGIRTGTSFRTRLLMLVALAIVGTVALAAAPAPVERVAPLDHRMEFDIPALPAEEARRLFHRLTGLNVMLPREYGNRPAKALHEFTTPEEAWMRLMLSVGLSGFAVNDRALAAMPFAERVFEINIERGPRIETVHALSTQTNVLMGYLPNDEAEQQELVGPIRGRKTIEEVSNIITAGTRLSFRWVDPITFVIEPIRIQPPPSEHVTVVSSPLAMLGEYIDAPVQVMDRRQIEDTGAATLAELLAYHSQTAFSTPEDFYGSGAQFAEMRGLGPAQTLILINGRRAYASASDLNVNAFDLGTIPISAIERVEMSYDATSIAHGTDAIGGVVNVVLRRRINTPTADLRFGGASGGAEQRRFTLSGGTNGERSRSALVLDYFERGRLMGYERYRWANEDWRRFGGPDNRTRYGSPANFSSTDGLALPGLDSSFAALRPTSESTVVLEPGQVNLMGFNAYRSILPEAQQISASGVGERSLGTSTLTIEALATQRANSIVLTPNAFSGILGAAHPQNPFGEDVRVDVLLTGLPTPTYHAKSHIFRLAAALKGKLLGWNYSAAVVRSHEQAKATLAGVTDQSAIAQSLLSADAGDALDIFVRSPGAGSIANGVLAPPQVNRYATGATQFTAAVDGPLLSLPAGEITAQLGVEHRREWSSFNSTAATRYREVTSGFAQLYFPVVSAAMNLRGIEDLALRFGARRDAYSEVAAITRTQAGATWHPHRFIKIHATASNSFRPPSLYDLFLPQDATPTTIVDPRRNEVVPILVITGGNSDLKPTTGSSRSYGILIGPEHGWRASFAYWQIQMRDRISLLPFFALISHEEETDRVVRAEATPADIAAGLPGPITTVDVSRVNFGELTTRGWDIGIQAPPLKTRFGTWTPRLDVTVTDQFKHRVLPGSPLADRVGVAYEDGTITPTRAVAGLTYEGSDWRATILGRYHSSYLDWNSTLGIKADRRIASHTTWDFNATKSIGKHAGLSFGIHDLLNKDPAYSSVGSAGFDPSLASLKGRTVYLSIRGSL